jgi:hydroxymethylbilane synthase
VPLRGNVDTRLRKLDAGEYDAVILAAAGLERLGLADRITQLMQPPEFWPAVAQGALGIQVRADDVQTLAAVAPLDHATTHAAVIAERRMLENLAGGCLAPIGGWARLSAAGGLVLGGCVLEMDEPTEVVRRIVAEETVAIRDQTEPAALGEAVAARLRAAGAEAMLQRMRTRLA